MGLGLVWCGGLLSCVWVTGCGCLQERGAVGWVGRFTSYVGVFGEINMCVCLDWVGWGDLVVYLAGFVSDYISYTICYLYAWVGRGMVGSYTDSLVGGYIVSARW